MFVGAFELLAPEAPGGAFFDEVPDGGGSLLNDGPDKAG
jgi:hypothetical protein